MGIFGWMIGKKKNRSTETEVEVDQNSSSEDETNNVKKVESNIERTPYCFVCSKISDQLIREPFPPGITSTLYYDICPSCASKYDGLRIEYFFVNRWDPKVEEFKKNFWECTCGALFVSNIEGLPFANTNFNAESCPVCRRNFPSFEQFKFELEDSDDERVYYGFTETNSPDDLKPVYNQLISLVKSNKTLSSGITNVMLVKNNDNSFQIWVTHKFSEKKRGSSIALEKMLSPTGFKCFSSGFLEFALKDKLVEVIDQMKNTS